MEKRAQREEEEAAAAKEDVECRTYAGQNFVGTSSAGTALTLRSRKFYPKLLVQLKPIRALNQTRTLLSAVVSFRKNERRQRGSAESTK
jgi:hypothetical protein